MKVAILHPGEMGISLASSALNSGHEVYWVDEHRSDLTRERAQRFALRVLPDLQSCCRQCDIIVSVCPPHAAMEQARAVAGCGFTGVYADVNAIAPQHVIAMAKQLIEAGMDFVDGGIIGPPAWEAQSTWLYLSGEKASLLAECFSKGPLQTELIGDSIGRASALKMCFAANTKGTTALQAAVLGAAEKLGVREILETQWDRYTPGSTDKIHTAIKNVAHKAWRFRGEMEEISATFKHIGIPDTFHQGAADIYARQEGFKNDSQPDIEAILEALLKQDQQS